MVYKKIKKMVTPKDLNVYGETAGDFLLDLQKKLPVSPLDTILPNGMKLSIGSEKMEIKLPKNKEIRSEIIEEILTEGTKLLLEENRRRNAWNRDRIKITMSLGDNTVYFAQGHLSRSPDGTVMPMYPVLDKTDETFIRLIDSTFTSDVSSLGCYIREQHNRTLGGHEEDRTQEIAEKLGFTTVEKDDSVINVQINGETDSCMVTRLCIHYNEFQNEETLLESIIKTYRDIRGLEENPLIIIGLNDTIDITIGRDRKTITIEHQYNEPSRNIIKLIKTVIGLFLTKEALENLKIEYKENIWVEGTLKHRIYENIYRTVEIIDKIREKHGHEITLGITLITIPLIFLFFLYSKTNPINSYFHAAIATIPSVICAVLITSDYRKRSWIKTFGQKKFPTCVWLFSILSYAYIHDLGFDEYLKTIFYIMITCIGIGVIIVSPYVWRKLSPKIEWIFSPVAKLFSPITSRLDNTINKMEKPFTHETIKKSANVLSVMLDKMFDTFPINILFALLSIVVRAILSIFGIIIVAIFAISFLPMIGLFVLVNFFNRGYWKEVDKYREDIIEKAVHKYRDERNLAPSCRVIFRTTKCKRLKNPLSGSWNVLRKKVPRLLTVDGFIDAIDKLILRGWM